MEGRIFILMPDRPNTARLLVWHAFAPRGLDSFFLEDIEPADMWTDVNVPCDTRYTVRVYADVRQGDLLEAL